MLVPGESFPSEGGSSTSSSDKSSSSGHGLSGGAIGGIVVACVVFVAILIALFFVLGRNRIYSRWAASEDGRTTDRGERTARWTMFGHSGDSRPKTELDSHEIDSTGASTHMDSIYGSPTMKSSFQSPSSPIPAPQYSAMEMQQTSRNIRGPVELDGQHVVAQLPDESRDYR
ncbi:hypothetical protein N7495_007777 [Penicillium taxi]|uniref:uncharacterized protein n=1 Tax=Penicillium taxi TaxID=168475 RepID=UPI0025456A30|nr:uncharacterized protein N7495_007777 [Penicillium taxi]KAJ5887736.1 hypothetical protein N7495_007777 [Penicillium taxi]